MRFLQLSCVLLLASDVGSFAPRIKSRGLNHLPTTSFSWGSSQIHLSETTTQAGEIEFTPEEQSLLDSIHDEAQDGRSLKDSVLNAMSTLPPGLVVKLRQATQHSNQQHQKIANEMEKILEETVEQAKSTLQELLGAGEIRKLDNLIGKAQREGRLNAAFFNVLQANMQDAFSKEAEEEKEKTEEEGASRVSILTHIHTRCQEEVEKNIPPGVALFNKLIRTEQPAIRRNIYDHYLTPQKTVIKSPDGKEIDLGGDGAPLVAHDLFVTAIADAVKQIRTVEQAGGANREMAANMVESCRSVAKEARIVIGEKFGIDSDELKAYELGLQPVFRPDTPESPYIKGEE